MEGVDREDGRGIACDGFMPPTRWERRNAWLQWEMEKLLRLAITLDESAVLVVPGPDQVARDGV